MGASGNGSSPDISPMSSGMGGSVGGDERTVLRVIVEMGENQNIYNQVNLDVLQHVSTFYVILHFTDHSLTCRYKL